MQSSLFELIHNAQRKINFHKNIWYLISKFYLNIQKCVSNDILSYLWYFFSYLSFFILYEKNLKRLYFFEPLIYHLTLEYFCITFRQRTFKRTTNQNICLKGNFTSCDKGIFLSFFPIKPHIVVKMYIIKYSCIWVINSLLIYTYVSSNGYKIFLKINYYIITSIE